MSVAPAWCLSSSTIGGPSAAFYTFKGQHFSQTESTEMYLKSYFVHLQSAAVVQCKMAAMCGPDCDDVMDDVSNSH